MRPAGHPLRRALSCAAVVVVLSGCAAEPGEPSGETVPEPPTTATAAASAEPSPDPEPTEEPEPERASDPAWGPDSIHVLVNRQNPLQPSDYEPPDLVVPEVRTSVEAQLFLREEAAAALEELFAAIVEDGMSLAMTSAYRSFELQAQIYTDRHAQAGTEQADRLVARPGYSEHQTGLAADVISIDNPECIHGDCFGETPEGKWVAEHADDFGFLVRYPEDAEHITGYPYEPWHLRYVGEEAASEVAEASVTLEEYWDQPAAAEYDQAEPNPEYLHGGSGSSSESSSGSATVSP